MKTNIYFGTACTDDQIVLGAKWCMWSWPLILWVLCWCMTVKHLNPEIRAHQYPSKTLNSSRCTNHIRAFDKSSVRRRADVQPLHWSHSSNHAPRAAEHYSLSFPLHTPCLFWCSFTPWGLTAQENENIAPGFQSGDTTAGSCCSCSERQQNGWRKHVAFLKATVCFSSECLWLMFSQSNTCERMHERIAINH